MDATHLISIRRREIEEELAALVTRSDDLRKELAEITVAERVVARLSGATGVEAGESEGLLEAPTSGRKPAGTPSMPEMILAVLEQARSDSLLGGYDPKTITKHIQAEWWPDMPPSVTNSIVWRMWKRGQLSKEGSIYMLPEKNEATDANLGGGTSVASYPQPEQQGREGGPGGGT